MESKERLKDDFAEAEAKRKLLRELTPQALLDELRRRDGGAYGDHRIRMMDRDGDLRVVAPSARLSNGTVYINNVLVIERATKDSLGNKIWTMIGHRLVDNESYSRSDPSVSMPRDLFNAIFKLLSDSER